MKSFNIKDLLDVECICNYLTKLEGELHFDINIDIGKLVDMPTTEPFLYKVGDREYHSVQQHEIIEVINLDADNRLPEKPDNILCTIVLGRDSDYFELETSELEVMKNKGNIAIHTPSKIIATVSGIYYSSERPIARSCKQDYSITGIEGLVNPVSIGKTHITGIPHLAVGLDKVLIKFRDEEYVNALKQCTDKIYVLDEFNKFLLECEGVESEIL